LPSITGNGRPGAVMPPAPASAVSGSLRSAAAASGPSPFTPAASASFTPLASASASGVGVVRAKPDSTTALWNSPFVCGEIIMLRMPIAPALSPTAVTFPGSPPNPAMLAFTHFRPAIWSMLP
jgi:hypothetical protein